MPKTVQKSGCGGIFVKGKRTRIADLLPYSLYSADASLGRIHSTSICYTGPSSLVSSEYPSLPTKWVIIYHEGVPVNENLPGCLGVGGSSIHLTNCSGTSGVYGNEHYAVYRFVCYTLSSVVVVTRCYRDGNC